MRKNTDNTRYFLFKYCFLNLPTTRGHVNKIWQPRNIYLMGTVGDPERWKWTFCHFPSRRCHTRVSSDCIVFGIPLPSMYCVSRMYAMQAASSPTRCTWGFRMIVWIGLLLLDKAERERYKRKQVKVLQCSKLKSGLTSGGIDEERYSSMPCRINRFAPAECWVLYKVQTMKQKWILFIFLDFLKRQFILFWKFSLIRQKS